MLMSVCRECFRTRVTVSDGHILVLLQQCSLITSIPYPSELTFLSGCFAIPFGRFSELATHVRIGLMEKHAIRHGIPPPFPHVALPL